MAFQPHYLNIEAAAAIRGGTAVVIDVLRAYTTAAWAFALGAERIVLSDDVQEALTWKARIPGALALKDAEPLPGFDLSNSPVEVRGYSLQGLTIIQRTTAGTVGAVAARHAERIYCASFLTAAPTARAILRSGVTEAHFIVTGDGGAADEDQACAEYIAALVEAGDPTPGVADGRVAVEPYLRRVAASNAAVVMTKRVLDGTPGVHAGDVAAAMEADRFDFVMVARLEDIEHVGTALVLRCDAA